jgi:effector-binding domain-containing protein
MPYEVRVEEAPPRRIAAVRETVKLADFPARVPGLLGEVWQHLRDNQVTTGHNVMVFLDNSMTDGEITFDTLFGVEVESEVPPGARIRVTETPGGRVATTTLLGPYAQLFEVHAAVRDWCAANGHELAGPCWEVYGDWTDDESQLRTDVYYVLR